MIKKNYIVLEKKTQKCRVPQSFDILPIMVTQGVHALLALHAI